jgi:hypothetical protein
LCGREGPDAHVGPQTQKAILLPLGNRRQMLSIPSQENYEDSGKVFVIDAIATEIHSTEISVRYAAASGVEAAVGDGKRILLAPPSWMRSGPQRARHPLVRFAAESLEAGRATLLTDRYNGSHLAPQGDGRHVCLKGNDSFGGTDEDGWLKVFDAAATPLQEPF